ncbi:MAG: ROK family protein [Porphyrobacter sp.]|nr:ROK family protein [Porphyrobacter sp.]
MANSLLTGVELGGTKCVCVLASGTGEILAQERVETEAPEVTLPRIKAILDRWFDAEADIRALGIASFGPIDVDRASPQWGHIGQTPKPGWTGVGVAQELGQGLGVPVALDTDVNGAALAEMRWGAAAGLEDFAYVTIGTGVGVGLVVGGAPIGGFGHAELGHMRIPRVAGDAWPGSCPYHGDCVEGLAAGPAIIARAGKRASLIAADDPIWDLVGHAIAQMLHNIVLTATPRRIFLGGGVITAQPQLFPIIRRELQASLGGYVASPELDSIDEYIVPPGLGALVGPLGPIALAAASTAQA